MKHEYIEANGIRMHLVTEGEGPLLLLLHGFPQYWHAWRYQIPALAKHFKVAALDLRGYGETDKPPNVSDYRPEILAADIASLIAALGYKKAHIAGHDWGGGVAWQTALRYPEIIDKLAIINCPHPAKMAEALFSNWTQIKKSWYIFFFQLPLLPEMYFKANSKKIMRKLFGNKPEREAYEKEISKPGAIRSAINYYRAARSSPLPDRKIACPTLIIWGEKDFALGKELTYDMENLFTGLFKIEYLPDAGHWAPEEDPEKINRLLLSFFLQS